MKVIACLDDRNGMLFNRRRQSSDREVLRDIAELCGEELLRMNAYSGKLFAEAVLHIEISEDFLEKAQPGEFCFVENQPLLPCEAQMEELIIYRWNRRYPGDFFLDLELGQWSCVSSVEFAGYSHEKITKERYLKGNDNENS